MNQIPEQYLSIFKGMQQHAKQQRAAFFEELVKVSPKRQIVFVGDSITEGFPLPELFTGYAVLNRGIGGDTTSDILNRLESIIALEPQKIFLLIGTNDLGEGETVTRTSQRIEEICNRISTSLSNTELYLISVLPVNENKKANPNHAGLRKNCDIVQLNAIISKINGVKFIDAAQYFIGTDGRLLESLTADGLHLNIDGYLKYSEILKNYLK